MFKTVLTLFLFSFTNLLIAQKAIIKGVVKDSLSGKTLEGAYIIIEETNATTFTNEKGNFTIKVPANRPINVYVTYLSQKRKIAIAAIAEGNTQNVEIKLITTITATDATVYGTKDRDLPSVITIDAKLAKKLPNPSGNFEALLKLLGPVTSNNELSSTYSVRGGNYDENLIYVNDIEIYRPQLIRSGQQEGLSFINPDLVSSVKFSAGGFEGKYGDKMSSVLDVKYRTSDTLDAGMSVSFLGAQAYLAGKVGNRLRYLTGARYRSNQYVLGSLDVQGNYKPIFADVQAFLTYDLSSRWQLSYLGSYAFNRYLFIPESQRTSFGTIQTALQLTVFFNGAELMRYATLMNGVTLQFKPSNKSRFRLITSNYRSQELEFFTTEGAYRLDELDKNLASETFGKAKFNRGFGYFINHARNEMLANVYNAALKAEHQATPKHFIEYGLQWQHENINDVLNEWIYNDSSDYSVPFNSGDSLFLFSFINGKNTLNSQRFTAYFQNSWTIEKESNMRLTASVRNNYWTLNKQHIISPRFQFSFEPNKKYNADTTKHKTKPDISLKAAFGYYYQPPFYRELRSLQGVVNPGVLAQRSIHYVAGGDLNLKIWDRPFRLFAEAYYKDLDNLIPYLYDNVRIRYYANNDSRGFARGIDTRLNGEFVKGLESWFSFSVMQTKEKITYDDEQGNRIESDWLPRPTDQRVNMTVFFQDELKQWPEYKVHLNFVHGSKLPYFLGGMNRYQEAFTMPGYNRVDIGFSREIIGESGFKKSKLNKYFNMMWVSFEVFNLFQINNTVSYIWVRDVNADVFGVPNYLTSRRINLNVMMKF
jgi:hypothetical protein